MKWDSIIFNDERRTPLINLQDKREKSYYSVIHFKIFCKKDWKEEEDYTIDVQSKNVVSYWSRKEKAKKLSRVENLIRLWRNQALTQSFGDQALRANSSC